MESMSSHGVRIGYIFDFAGQKAGGQAVPTIEHALTEPPEALIGFGIGGIEAGRAPYTDLIRDLDDGTKESLSGEIAAVLADHG